MRLILTLLSAAVIAQVLLPHPSFAANLSIENTRIRADFDQNGLVSVKNVATGRNTGFASDQWSLVLDGKTLHSTDAVPAVRKAGPNEVDYSYWISGYRIEAAYRLKAGWRFVTKQIHVITAPGSSFTVQQVSPVEVKLTDPIQSMYVPSSYTPQVGLNIEQTRKRLPGRDYGAFLRFKEKRGMMLVVQNPYLNVERDGQSVAVTYVPEMPWKTAWGEFSTDPACIGPYQLSGERLPRELAMEWKLPPAMTSMDGMDRAGITAFADCVRAFLVDPSPDPISVEVGWTLNDYQIDVGTPEGVAEYKRIIDTAAELGIHSLLYAPENSKLARRADSSDSWHWEYVLWLGLGEKIRSGAWDPASSAIPDSVSTMVAYAKARHVGLLAYVYPSIPFSHDRSWLVTGQDGKYSYATLSSRKLQDYLIRNLIAFHNRTGIAGYSFDYTWLDLSGSSSYAQWFGWRRVMESLRRALPDIVIDGRQSYQMFGPWSWLAGSYPHPTGTDEQPESFTPFPDLHFDRVSADRTRYVNYWYRNYEFAPAEVVPGYATHQTERSKYVPSDAHGGGQLKMMYTRFRARDWDYLGFRYSFLSSIATGGWNNVVDMIPARDPEEAKHFSAADKAWIRGWLDWTVRHKEYVRHTRSILQPPAIGHVDGTSMIVGGRGYLFLFNPNYRSLPATMHLDESIGLTAGSKFLLREIYPRKGLIVGKPGSGIWTRGDMVRLSLSGTSATVLELVPAMPSTQPIVMNAGPGAAVTLAGDTLSVAHAAGEPGSEQELGVLLPTDIRIKKLIVNGETVRSSQTGRYVSASIRFAGTRFSKAQQVALAPGTDGLLRGSFAVPQGVFDQLAARKKAWPIPWTPQDYQSTWLAPARLLLFVQFAEPDDSMKVEATLDGRPLELTRAYTSVHPHSPSFVGFYADLSKIVPDARHSFTLRLPQLKPGQFQGVFFENVEPRFTEELGHS